MRYPTSIFRHRRLDASKHRKMKASVIIAATIFLYWQPTGDRWGANAASLKDKDKGDTCDPKRFDRCGATVCYYCRQDGFRIPASEREMVSYCREEKEAEECIKTYANKCLEPFPRQALQIFLSTVSKTNAQRCTPRGIREHLENYQCLDRSFEGLRACTNHSIYEMMGITKMAYDDQIPTGCCLVNKWKKCMFEAYSGVCDERGVRYIRKRVAQFGKDLVELACGEQYALGSEKCRKLEAKLPKNDGKEPRPKSMLPLMLKLIDSYA